jgi:fructose-bisphosphate aldolase, class II
MKKKDYLQTQVGNPDGADKPNKKVSPTSNLLFFFADTHLFKFYDPRVWVREGEKTLAERVKEACKDLGNVSRL